MRRPHSRPRPPRAGRGPAAASLALIVTPGRGSKAWPATTTPPRRTPAPEAPVPEYRPSPAPARKPWARRSPRHLPATARPQSRPVGTREDARRGSPTRPAGERRHRPAGSGTSNFSRPPPNTTTRVPTAPGAEPGQPQARTHLELQAPPPLPGCSAPRPRSAPCRPRLLRTPRP